MTIAVCAVMTIGLLLYVFVVPQEVERVQRKSRAVYLRERRDVVYENLRDLNFEHRAGKLSDTDFEPMRSAMEAEAATLLAEIDSLESGTSAARS
jgi:hypothetical protein